MVEGVDGLDMNNRDTMGDVYEYVLGKMAASGTNGQFRTPRHIIAMMVELMKPTIKDTICDPAMGSAGFIVESAKYVKAHYADVLMKRENQEHYRNRMFHGFDTDQTMLRIGAMNLMLHSVDNPDIGSIDKEVIAKSLTAIASTKKTELLFVALFTRMLELGGRCASIVPDGVLFGTSAGHKAIRKELVDHQRLQAVISMPSGVFKPYAGVSTAILIFTKTNSGGTDKVWFYDMRADGFSLDDKRNPVSENDIPDIIYRYEHLEEEEQRSRKEQSFFVPADEIRANDYDLSINKYKEVERERVEYEPVKPEDITQLERIMWEELGTREDYVRYTQSDSMNVAMFIRSVIKVDRQVALEKFTNFLNGSTLNARQMEYLKSIIAYVCENGDIEPQTLMSVSPFNDINIIDLFDDKAVHVGKYVNMLHTLITA